MYGFAQNAQRGGGHVCNGVPSNEGCLSLGCRFDHRGVRAGVVYNPPGLGCIFEVGLSDGIRGESRVDVTVDFLNIHDSDCLEYRIFEVCCMK